MNIRKMNILQILKNGSGIYIKPSQKGSFTKYCKGKVTEECIRKGKNSPDPKIRKKATFAANSRKWKHQEGGQIIKAQNGIKNFLTSEQGQNLLGGIFTNLMQTKKDNSQLSNEANQQKARNQEIFNDYTSYINNEVQKQKNYFLNNWRSNYINGLTQDNPSEIVSNHYGYNNYSQKLNQAKDSLLNENKIIDEQLKAKQSENWNNTIGSIFSAGQDLLSKYLGNKQTPTINNNSSTSKTFTKNPNTKA